MQKSRKTPNNKSIFTPEKTVRFFIVSAIGYTAAAMIIWPLLELIFAKISDSPYSWTAIDGILEPCIFGVIITTLEFLFWNFFHNKK